MVNHRADLLAEQIRAARNTLQRLEAEATRIASLPEEPQPTNDDPYPTITFEIVFGDGGVRTYHYAARRAGSHWYTTGPKGGVTPRTWEDLILWIDTSNALNGIQGANVRRMSAGESLA